MCRLGDAPTRSVTAAPGGTRVTDAQREVSGVSKRTPGGPATWPRRQREALRETARGVGAGGSPRSSAGKGSTQAGNGTWPRCGPEDRDVTARGAGAGGSPTRGDGSAQRRSGTAIGRGVGRGPTDHTGHTVSAR